METPGLRRPSHQMGNATKYEPVHLGTLEESSSLTELYNLCSRDIKHCIVQAQQAGLDVERLSRSRFEPIEKLLLEYNFRLDIWSSDCGVAKGYLEHISGLTQPVRDIFRRLHEQLEAVSERINKFREYVPKDFAHSNTSDPARENADTLVDRQISEIKDTCDKMTRMLLELCELQPLIQTAQALDLVGPQHGLRNDILHLKSHYPQDAGSYITSSSIPSAETTGGDEENREQCSFCNKWFSFGTLDFHQEFCSAAEVQQDGTPPSSGQATFGFYNPNSLKALWWVSSSVDKTPVRLPDCPGKDELEWHKYQHIDASHQIRLIELLPPQRHPARSNSLECIRCKIHCTNLDQNPEYEALSYTWGSMSRSLVISVLLGEDEEEALFATPQLVMALTRLRLPSKSRFLWIDQLCIDQKNEDEKGPQIQLMGQIYQKAQRVVIWLGEACNNRPEYDTKLSDSELLSNLCNEFAQSDNKTPAEDVELARKLVAFRFVAIHWDKTIEDVRLLAIYEVLNRPWFRRAWVFQEASLAREITVQYGSFEVRFEEFKRVMDAVYSLGSSFGISERRGLAFDTCGFEMMKLIQEARQGFLETHLEDSGTSKGIGFLPTLLRVLRRVDAFNPRDLIFAFLAFQNDEGIRSTKESYQLSPEDVWLQAAEQIIKTSGSLDIFAALSGDTPRQLRLPSWVPYWSDCFPYSRPIAAPGSRFRASRGLPHIWKKQDPQKLVVQGKIVDSIKEFPGPIPDPFVAQSFGSTPAWNIIWIGLESYPRRFLNRHSDTLADELPVKLQTLNSDLVRTLLCDGAMGSQQPLRCVPQMTRAIAAIPAAKSLRELRDAGQNMNFTEEQSELLENYEKLEDLALVAEKKRMFWTENLQLGMACEDVKIGDQIAIIHGSKVPCLLRAVGAGSGEYRVISQCYLDGWMYGKPPKDRPHPHGTWWEEEQDEFVLV